MMDLNTEFKGMLLAYIFGGVPLYQLALNFIEMQATYMLSID